MQMHGYEHTINAGEFMANAEASQVTGDTRPAGTPGSLENIQPTQWKDSIDITIPVRGNKEYKLFLPKGATLVYSWQTDGEELFFDFHGEPADDTTGYFESFKKSTYSQSSGSLTSSCEGTHGWYWKNSTRSPITITLKVNGEYQRVDLKDKTTQTKSIQPTVKTTHESIDSL